MPNWREYTIVWSKILDCIPRYIVRQGRSYTVRQGRSSRLSSSPKNLKFGFTILHTFHDSVIEGHLGHLRTYKCIATELFWEVMRNDIRKYVDQCPSCQQNKIQALSSAGLLQPLPIPDRIWEDISVDFVEGLLRSKGFDTVLVVVDRLSKYAHFLPLRHPFSAKTVAMVFIKEVIRLHGFPQFIVFDHDRVFLSFLEKNYSGYKGLNWSVELPTTHKLTDNLK